MQSFGIFQVRSAERHQGEQERRPVTPEEEVRSPSTSLSPTPQHFNAKVKTSNDGSERGASPRGNNLLSDSKGSSINDVTRILQSYEPFPF